MNKDDQDPNSLLIPCEKDLSRKPMQNDNIESCEQGRFSIMPTQASSCAPSKGTKSEIKKSTSTSHERMTSENYQQLYKKREAQRQAEAAFKARQEASGNQSLLDKQRDDQNANHAHNIKEQLDYWHSQRGQGEHDEALVQGMIDRLNSELGALPHRYW